MQTLFIAALLAAVLSFFVAPLQNGLRAAIEHRRWLIWTAPLVLTAVFALAAALAGTFSLTLILLVLLYTFAPVACLWFGTNGFVTDMLAILFLWLPLEFSAGASLIPRPAQGFLHSVAYGIAILLGLILFLGFRDLKGMKICPPAGWHDLWIPLAAFAITAPVLIAVGFPIGFIPPGHLPTAPAGRMAAAVGLIFAGTALPEEILFRSLIQNVIVQRWGSGTLPLLAASFIFGCAHLDNGPQPLPNWRYMILATIAGFAYGKVFHKCSSVVSSALLHTLVDWTKHFFF
jgi:membrane protease YdiL (CAAX protease family)